MRFAHDYWLDTAEVTQAEYQDLMGRNPAPVAARSTAKPVVNVTWFEAALFCNARSKRDHLDTVYEYTSMSSDPSGSTWNLQSLTSHLERNGWRLPTEAEWEYAARAGSTATYPWGELADSIQSTEYAWFQRNAGDSLHEVAKLKPNAWGFYDMAGNAMEWVQDWKGSFPKDTVTDFAGPDAPSDVPEAPLKGGAYNYGLEHLRPSSRTATYAAYRSAKAEYVGFRCARGGFAPTYTNASGQSVQAPPVSILRSDLAKLLGAQSARLVFLNRFNDKGILSWIDYGEATPVVRGLPDKDPVFHPVISPDGKWVAWCTVMEGSTGSSRIKARRLAKNDSVVLDLGRGAIPRWWVSGTDTFLIRSGSAMDNTAEGWQADQTTAQRWSNGTLADPIETWSETGGYHDGRSGQYLYTGYRRLMQYDISRKTARTLFTYPLSGKAAGDTSQVCNVSASPNGNGRVMFLDFGYNLKSSVVGRPYGIHEVAFVADSSGLILMTFPVASGKSQWDHLEWSNHPQWAVGVAVESDGFRHKEIQMLDLNTGSALPIARGDELWMPQLWAATTEIGNSPGLIDMDSCGAYDKKADPTLQNMLGDGVINEFAAKLSNFWDLKDSLELVFVGSSRVKMGFLPTELTAVNSFNFGFSGSELYDEDLILRRYILPSSTKLKFVCIGLMPGWFSAFDGRTNGFKAWQSIENSYGYLYDKNHDYWTASLPEGFFYALHKNRSNLGIAYHPFGEIRVSPGQWSTQPKVAGADAKVDVRSLGFVENFTRLERLISDLSEKNIRVLMVNFPVNPDYKSTLFAEEYGPTWSVNDSLIQKMLELSAQHQNFRFYDANQRGNHDYKSEDAYDDGHLSYLGAKKLTARIDSIISGWQ